jgi:membrane protein
MSGYFVKVSGIVRAEIREPPTIQQGAGAMGNLKDLLSNLYQIDLQSQQRGVRILVTTLRFLNELRHQFTRDTVVVRASGMAYTTLLAIVPLMAVLFSVMSAFSQFAEFKDQIQSWIFTQIVPAKSDELLVYINQFTANTKALGVFSAFFLFITSIMLFDNIEKNFNALWNVTRKRSFIKRFMTFSNVLMWGPIFFAMSFYVSGKLRLMFSTAAFIEIGWLTRFTFGMLPYVFTMFGFSLMLLVIPATKVKLKSALLGGAIGGAIWEVAKILFTHTTAKSITYNAIYGSLAVVPIFLVWLYLTWIIALLACEISYVHHNFHALVLHRAFSNPSPREKIHIAVRLYAHVARNFHLGKRPLTLIGLEDRFNIPQELADELTGQMKSVGLLLSVELDHDEEGFVPGRSLSSTRVVDVVEAVYREGQDVVKGENLDELDRAAAAILIDGETQAGLVFAQTNLQQLIEKMDQDTEA